MPKIKPKKMKLQNEYISVEINPKGAELKSIKDAKQNEFMWSADPAFWGKSSPILFPIVGSLKENTYQINDKKYHLSRHGFARDYEFTEIKVSDSKVIYELSWNPETLVVFPFEFSLQVIYEIEGNTLNCTYVVTNPDGKTLYFSLGAHPAFQFTNVGLNDYALTFNNDTRLDGILLDNGLLSETSQIMELQNQVLPLSYALFSKDALVFRNLKSNQITLSNSKNNQRLKFKFDSFTHFGIWSAPNADFVCLEPWCGVADAVNHNQDFTSKEGIVKLDALSNFTRTWSVQINA